MHHCYLLGLPSGFFIIILHTFLVCLVDYTVLMTGSLVNVGQLMDSKLMEEAKYSEKTYICAIFSIRNHRWPDLGWNLCFHSGKPMTNSYSYYHCYFIISYYSYYCLPVILWLLCFLLLQWIAHFRNGTSVILASQVCARATSLWQRRASLLWHDAQIKFNQNPSSTSLFETCWWTYGHDLPYMHSF